MRAVSTHRIGRIGAGAGLVLLSVAGCIFEPREPESGGTGEVCYEAVPQNEQINVFANIDGALECLQARTYLDQLSDDFVFVPSPGVQAQFPDLFPDPEAWGVEEEEQFLDRLFADAETVQASVYEQVQPPTGGSEPLYEGRYSITVINRDGSQIEYTGEAFFTLRQERTAWFIVRWEEKASDSPFGQLRAQLLAQGG